jgi:hypothetical protein
MTTTESKDEAVSVDACGVTFLLQNPGSAHGGGVVVDQPAAALGRTAQGGPNGPVLLVDLPDVVRRELRREDGAVGQAADPVGVRGRLLGDLEALVPPAVVAAAYLDRDA